MKEERFWIKLGALQSFSITLSIFPSNSFPHFKWASNSELKIGVNGGFILKKKKTGSTLEKIKLLTLEKGQEGMPITHVYFICRRVVDKFTFAR